MKTHMTPQQAAEAVGLSRWAVLRAIKSLALKAVRDNRGVWRIAPDDLADWVAQRAQPVRARASGGAGSGDLIAQLAAAEVRAAAAERARDVAEADRDHWRALAERLAARPRWWWFR